MSIFEGFVDFESGIDDAVRERDSLLGEAYIYALHALHPNNYLDSDVSAEASTRLFTRRPLSEFGHMVETAVSETDLDIFNQRSRQGNELGYADYLTTPVGSPNSGVTSLDEYRQQASKYALPADAVEVDEDGINPVAQVDIDGEGNFMMLDREVA